MADTQKRIDELAESSEKARKAGRIRESLSLPEDKRWDAPFSGVSLKSVYDSRKAASDKLQNLRDEETEALMQRQKMETSKEGKAKGGKVKAYAKGGSVSARADGCAQRGKTKGRFV